VAVALAGPYEMLTSFDLLQGLLLPSTHRFTMMQGSSLHPAVKAGSHSEIEKRALPPPCFPGFNFQSSWSQLCYVHCTCYVHFLTQQLAPLQTW